MQVPFDDDDDDMDMETVGSKWEFNEHFVNGEEPIFLKMKGQKSLQNEPSVTFNPH